MRSTHLDRRARSRTLPLLAVALVAVWPLTATPTASPAIHSGVQLTPASNLSAIAGQHADGTTYCLAATSTA